MPSLHWASRRLSPGLAMAAALALSGLPVTPGPAAAETIDMAGVKLNVVERTLDNGLKLVMVENHQSPTVGLIAQFAVGSVDEWDGISGSAHILEHLLFKGTAELGTTDWKKEKPLLDRIETTAQELRRERGREFRADPARLKQLEATLDSLQQAARAYVTPNPFDRIYTEQGGQGFNAGTSWDGTSYEVALPSNRLELWMKIESDRLKGPVLREFYTELKNIMEERRLRLEDEPAGPIGKMSEVLYSNAYLAHRYGVPIIGWVSDIDLVTRTEVENFFRVYYAPNRMTLAIVGDIDPDKTYEMARAYFGSIPRQPDPFPPRTIEPKQQGERRFVVEYEAEPRVFMAWHVMAGLDPDFPAYLVMNSILSTGRSSRFIKNIVEKQKVAASVAGYTGIPGERYPGLYVVEATPLAPHTTADVEAAIGAELDRLRKEPPTEAEMAAAKIRYRKDFVEGLVDNLGLASQLAYSNATLGDWRETFRRAEAVEKVTARDVQRVAATYLTASNRTVGTLVKPVKEEAFVDPADQAEAVGLVGKVRAALGGEAALAALKDTRSEATLTINTPQGGIPATEKQTLTTDGRLKSEVGIMGQVQVQSFDGAAAWMSSPAGTMDAPPDAVANMQDGIVRDLFLIRFDPGAAGAAVRRLPDAEFQGTPAIVLEVTPATGKPFVLYLDPATHLPRGRSFDAENPLTGQSGRAEEVLLDWKPAGGVQFPSREEFWMGGQKIIDKVVTQRTVNTGVTPDEFRRPS